MDNVCIIIGAPRSGTNMLREVVTKFNGVHTWPCDEINYIWRYGNASFPSDQLRPEHATDRAKKYIRNQFQKIRKKTGASIVVEKTCANSLRVPFVKEVCPNAKYIFIVRDGLDVVGSASIRWKAKPEYSYLLKKARYVPALDLPYYASRYFLNHLTRLFSKTKDLAFWGPSTIEMDMWLENYSIQEVCALQWKACVEYADKSLQQIEPNNIHKVSYESFVTNPLQETQRLAEFLDRETTTEVDAFVNETINNSSVGKGREKLTTGQILQLREHIGSTLERFGYE